MPKRPNIILFNPDQWRGDVLGHVGNSAAVTPVLDDLVKADAVSFAQAFCQNPVCMPSRCSYLTGQYPHTLGHRSFTYSLHPERGEPNLLKELKDAGYFVWWSGKNDALAGQVPEATTLSCHVRYRATAADYARWGFKQQPRYRYDWRGQPGDDSYFSFYIGRLDTQGAPLYFDRDWADVYGACEFIRNYDDEQPFCLFMALEMPHPDYGVEEPWFSLINRGKLPARVGEMPSGKCASLREQRRFQNMESWNEARWTELRATYYGMCSRVDHQLGLILQALRDRGIYDDTALFCFADHGDYAGDFGLVQKNFVGMDDCLTRVPFIIKPPRTVPVQPRVTPALVELVDMTETVYALAGINPAYRRFGRDLRPVLAGSTDECRDTVFCESGRLRGEVEAMHVKPDTAAKAEASEHKNEYWAHQRQCALDEPVVYHGKVIMCRDRRFKLVLRMYESDEFYDLAEDPAETHNQIGEARYAGEIARLRDRAFRWLWETADVVPYAVDAR